MSDQIELDGEALDARAIPVGTMFRILEMPERQQMIALVRASIHRAGTSAPRFASDAEVMEVPTPDFFRLLAAANQVNAIGEAAVEDAEKN